MPTIPESPDKLPVFRSFFDSQNITDQITELKRMVFDNPKYVPGVWDDGTQIVEYDLSGKIRGDFAFLNPNDRQDIQNRKEALESTLRYLEELEDKMYKGYFGEGTKGTLMTEFGNEEVSNITLEGGNIDFPVNGFLARAISMICSARHYPGLAFLSPLDELKHTFERELNFAIQASVLRKENERLQKTVQAQAGSMSELSSENTRLRAELDALRIQRVRDEINT